MHFNISALTMRVVPDAGYGILASPGGKQALKLITEHFNTVDLLLANHMMPGMNGGNIVAARSREPGPLPQRWALSSALLSERLRGCSYGPGKKSTRNAAHVMVITAVCDMAHQVDRRKDKRLTSNIV